MEQLEDKTSKRIKAIAGNGMVAALYYGLTMLFMLVPAISQFGPIQCRLSEMLVLLAFFRPEFTIGLTIGCFFSNLTGLAMGMTIPLDLLFGTLATLIACLFEAYLSPRLWVAAIYPVVFNGFIVGLELYFLLNDTGLPWYACVGFVALGELIAIAVGYILFFILMRNEAAMRAIGATRHLDVRC